MTRSFPNPNLFLAAVLDKLRNAGPATIAALEQEDPFFDGRIMLSAFSAAGNLTDNTVGELGPIRDRLIVLARKKTMFIKRRTKRIVFKAVFAIAEDQYDVMCEMIAHGGVVHTLPKSALRTRIDNALVLNEAYIAFTAIGQELTLSASDIAEQLALPDDHPTARILELLQSSVSPPSEAAFRRGVAKAKQRLKRDGIL